MRRTRLAAAGLGTATLLGLAACGGSGGSAKAGPSYFGPQLTSPLLAPAGTFSSTAGGTEDLSAHLQGHVTLIFFGYTHCPDECPTTMAAIGAALRSLPATTAKDVQVVFVTSDPARDTVPVLAKWLASFDNGIPNPFVGLTTDVKTVDAYAAKLGIELDPPTIVNGTEEVTHGAQVLAFGHDGKANLVWLPGSMTVKQYASDITTLTQQPA